MTYGTNAPPIEVDDGWIVLAVAEDAAVAERWSRALEAEGIEAAVRIGDAAVLQRGSSAYPFLMPGGHRMFAYPLLVPREERERAAGVLVDQGWDGRAGQRGEPADFGRALRGALLATAAGVAVAVLLLLRGG